MAFLQDILGGLGLPSPDLEGVTPESIDARRKLAAAMLARGQDTSGVRSTTQGLNSVLQSMLGAYGIKQADEADKLGKKEADDLLAKVFSGAPVADLNPSSATKGASGFSTATATVSPSGGVRDSGGGVDATDPLALIKKEEGFAPVAKWDKRQYSGGYGSKAAAGETFDRAKAEQYLQRDAAGPLAWVEKNAPNATPQQRAALVSFGYNLGEDDLEKLKPDIVAGDWNRVATRMVSFNKALNERTGKLEPMEALTNRRKREAALIVGGAQPEMAGGPGADVLAPGARPAAPGAAARPAAQQEQVQRALLLMRNPRTAELGRAMLQKLALADTSQSAPTIVEVPSADGGKIPMVYNRQTGQLDPITTLISGAGSPAGGAEAFQPLNPPAGASLAPAAAEGFVPVSAQPEVAAAAAGLPAGSGVMTGMPPEPITKTSFIGEVGPSGMQPPAAAPLPPSPVPTPAPAMPSAPSPLPASAPLADLPAGALTGPVWRGKVPEGMIQRQTPDGRFLYGPDRQPLLELKSAADARAKGAEKRATNEADKDAVKGERQDTANRFGAIIADLRGLPDQFGKIAFERAIGPNQASSPEGAGYLRQGLDLFTQVPARLYAEANTLVQGGAVPTEVRDTTEQKLLSLATLTKPLVRGKGEGAWTDADQLNLEKLVGQATRARTVDEYQRRVDEVVRTFEKAFGVDVPDMKPSGRSENAPQTAEDAIKKMSRTPEAEAQMVAALRRIGLNADGTPISQPAAASAPMNAGAMPQDMNPLLRAMLERR